MSDIKTVWEGQYIKVDLVDTTTECTVANNVYSLTEMMNLHQELEEAFGVTWKELQEMRNNVTYSEQMQDKLEPIEE
tara:strand:- start:47 stop:277 length:231 start_codon:yes stop_codon:yes gene_type:complete